MPFKPKVGIISCSGEACNGGRISREASLEVLHKLRPTETITICLPLFLAGDEGERDFAKIFPTITVDGCSKYCAAVSTAKHSSEPSAKINVEEYYEKVSLSTEEESRIKKRSDLVKIIAEDIAKTVDKLRNEWS